jgi:hypothetical protein
MTRLRIEARRRGKARVRHAPRACLPAGDGRAPVVTAPDRLGLRAPVSGRVAGSAADPYFEANAESWSSESSLRFRETQRHDHPAAKTRPVESPTCRPQTGVGCPRKVGSVRPARVAGDAPTATPPDSTAQTRAGVKWTALEPAPRPVTAVSPGVRPDARPGAGILHRPEGTRAERPRGYRELGAGPPTQPGVSRDGHADRSRRGACGLLSQ